MVNEKSFGKIKELFGNRKDMSRIIQVKFLIIKRKFSRMLSKVLF